jgi:signal transduction histidine kinase/ligand-binding sensor domain-containing protein
MQKYVLIILLIVSGYQAVLAQESKLKFTKLNLRENAEIGQVNDIAQDKYGFIWLSEESNGSLTRYDGQNLKRYQHDDRVENSLGGTYPETLHIDDSGIIWVGFYGQGLDKFDPYTETFTHYRHDSTDVNSLSNDFVTAILRDHLGNLWVGTYGGLDLLNEETGRFSHHQFDANDPASLSSNYVRKLYEDRQGSLWVGTGWLDDSGGLNRLNSDSDTFTRYILDAQNPQSPDNTRISAIFEDTRGNFWIGTGGNRIFIMDREKGKFTPYDYDPKNPNKPHAPGEPHTGFGVTLIDEDIKGNLWIGSGANGINMYDPVAGEVTHFGGNTDASGTFIENGSWCIYMDMAGIIWLSTQPGLYSIDLFNYIIPKVDEAIPSFFKQSDSVVWYGLHTGLVKENYNSGMVKKWKHDPTNPNTISNDIINRLLMDSQGMLWIGTSSGLNQLDPKQNKVTRHSLYPSDSAGMGVTISSIFEDEDGELWVGTINQGLYKLDRTTGKFIQFHNSIISFTNSISNIVGGDKDEIWIGGLGGGSLSRLNKKSGVSQVYSIGNGINQIYRDTSGSLWATSPSGLFIYDEVNDRFKSVSNYPMISIIEDLENNIWVSGLTYVLRINENKNYNLRYSGEYVAYQGFLNKFRAGGFLGQDGSIVLGDNNNYYSFNPNLIQVPPDTSRLYLTEFWIGETQVNSHVNGSEKKSLFETDVIQLNYDQNIFSFVFTEIDFRNNGRNKVSYLLENYDSDWRDTFSDEKVSYYQVPHGQYSLKIKAPNSSTGLWANKSISIIIYPPWWLTWWAYIIYGLLFISGVFTIDRIQRRRLLKIAMAEAKDKELAQAREIEKAYKELKATQQQLIQSEKMASLGELTAGIAHEIQNPLNFVNNFSDVNKELADELLQEIRQGNVEEAESIAKDIISNEDKILHHGKRADGIVKGMLQHSRAGGGEKEATDINALADEYLRLAYHGLRAKDKSFNADFKTELDPKLPKVNVVPQDIGRVLLNLINNAFHAVSQKSEAEAGSEDYKPTVILRTTFKSPLEGGHDGLEGKQGGVMISITDNGPGIPDSIKDKIFQPFFTTKSTGEGTGLGLSLSFDIITKGHGGKIEVKSKVGKGTEFIITLPIE